MINSRGDTALGEILVDGAFHGTGVVVQNDAEEGAVHLKVPVVIDETEFPESVHEVLNVPRRSSEHRAELGRVAERVFEP